MRSDPVAALVDAMRAHGLVPVNADIVSDGLIHRYRVDGDRPGSKNGFYALHLEPIPHGVIGSWRTGETHPWRDADARKINWQERQDRQRRMAKVRSDRFQEQKEVWAEARAKAAKMWQASRPANPHHAYLGRKQVKPWGLRQLRDNLLIPVRRNGVMHSLQIISPDGSKKFLTGGMVRGCYFGIGKPAGTICIAEGFATAATVYEATGHATAVAFNAGNLSLVARDLFAHFPRTRLIVIADDDHATPGNPGLTEATRAAAMVGGLVARPDFNAVRTV